MNVSRLLLSIFPRAGTPKPEPSAAGHRECPAEGSAPQFALWLEAPARGRHRA